MDTADKMETEQTNETVIKDIKRSRRKKKVTYTYRVHMSSHERSLHRSRNQSYNSSKLHKTSLRANNRALARAVAQLKEEYRCLHGKYMTSLSEQQGLMMTVSEMQGLVRMNNQDLDKEVDKRLSDRSKRLREALNQITNNLMSTVQLLGNAIEMCGPSRPVSLYVEESDDSLKMERRVTQIPRLSTTCSGQATQVETSESNAGIEATRTIPEDTPLEQALEKAMKRTVFDMSVIMEQSCLMSPDGGNEEIPEHPGIGGDNHKPELDTITEDERQTYPKNKRKSSQSTSVSLTENSAGVSSDNVQAAFLNQSPRMTRRSSCLKDAKGRMSAGHRRVSFEDMAKISDHPLYSLNKDLEKPNRETRMSAVSPRKSKRRASKAVDNPPTSQTQGSVTDLKNAHLQTRNLEQELSNRRETFVVSASKQIAHWPIPNFADEAFDCKKVEELTLPIENHEERNEQSEQLNVEKDVVEPEELGVLENNTGSLDIKLPAMENLVTNCVQVKRNCDAAETLPPAVTELNWLDDSSQFIDSEDQTCLMIHTMELTEALNVEIEHNVPCEVPEKSLQDNVSGVPDERVLEECGGVLSSNAFAINSEEESSKPLKEPDKHDNTALSETKITNDKVGTQDETRAVEVPKKQTETKKKHFGLKSRVSKLALPHHSFFSAKKLKTSITKKGKHKKNKDASVAVEDNELTKHELKKDVFSWHNISPNQAELTEKVNVNTPDENESIVKPQLSLQNSLMVLIEDCRSPAGMEKAIELAPGCMLPEDVLGIPKSSECGDIELPRGNVQSPKKRPPIVFSDSSDTNEDEDDTWVPPGKKAKSKLKRGKTASMLNNVNEGPATKARKSCSVPASRRSRVKSSETVDNEDEHHKEATRRRTRTKSVSKRNNEIANYDDAQADSAVLARTANEELEKVNIGVPLHHPKGEVKTRNVGSENISNNTHSTHTEDKLERKIVEVKNDDEEQNEKMKNTKSVLHRKETSIPASISTVQSSEVFNDQLVSDERISNGLTDYHTVRLATEEPVVVPKTKLVHSTLSELHGNAKATMHRSSTAKRLQNKSKDSDSCHEDENGYTNDAFKSPDGMKRKLQAIGKNLLLKESKYNGVHLNGDANSTDNDEEHSEIRNEPDHSSYDIVLKQSNDLKKMSKELSEIVPETLLTKQYIECKLKNTHSNKTSKNLLPLSSEEEEKEQNMIFHSEFSGKPSRKNKSERHRRPTGGKSTDTAHENSKKGNSMNGKVPPSQLSSPTAVNLEKAKQRLDDYVQQNKSKAANVKSEGDKRKWRIYDSTSDDENDVPQNLKLDEKCKDAIADGRMKPRRATALVSYKEPGIGRKLRQGDPHTDGMFLTATKPRNKKRAQVKMC